MTVYKLFTIPRWDKNLHWHKLQFEHQVIWLEELPTPRAEAFAHWGEPQQLPVVFFLLKVPKAQKESICPDVFFQLGQMKSNYACHHLRSGFRSADCQPQSVISNDSWWNKNWWWTDCVTVASKKARSKFIYISWLSEWTMSLDLISLGVGHKESVHRNKAGQCLLKVPGQRSFNMDLLVQRITIIFHLFSTKAFS